MFGLDEVVKFLLDAGADINEFDHDDTLSSQDQVDKGWPGYNAAINNNGSIKTAIQVSIDYMQETCFRILLQRNADVNLAHSQIERPIFLLIRNACLFQVKLKQKSDYFYIDFLNQSYCSMLRSLLEAGADVNDGDSNSETVLMNAIQTGSEQIFNIIMSFKPDLNLCNNSGFSPLHTTVLYGYWNQTIIKALIEGGADVTARDHYGDTALHILPISLFTCYDDQQRKLDQFKYIVDLLSTNGADINAQNSMQTAPLTIAIKCGIYNCIWDTNMLHNAVDILIEAGACLNVCDFHTTPAHALFNKLYQKTKYQYIKEQGSNNILYEFQWLVSRDVDVDMRSFIKQGLLHRVVKVDTKTGLESPTFGDEIMYFDSDSDMDYGH